MLSRKSFLRALPAVSLAAFAVMRGGAVSAEAAITDGPTLNADGSISWHVTESLIATITIKPQYHDEGFYKIGFNTGLQVDDGYAMDFWPSKNAASIYASSSNTLSFGSPTGSRQGVRMILGPSPSSPWNPASPAPVTDSLDLYGAWGGAPAAISSSPRSWMNGQASGVSFGRNGGDKIGFFGVVTNGRPTVSGSWSDGSAQESLVSALAALGLIYDNTTA